MRKRNWADYNKQLIQRGSITFLVDPKIFKPSKRQGFGRPQYYSDPLIMMLMMVKIQYHLTYRSLEGFISSIILLTRQSFVTPSYSLVCKRARILKLPKLSSRRPTIVAIDASGLKIYGEGEWKVKVHGKSKRRKWLKIHIGVDVQTGEIVAHTTTHGNVHDARETENLMQQMEDSVKVILADGAYDGAASRNSIRRKGAKPLIPPPKNARLQHTNSDRDDALRVIRGFGGDMIARSLWGKLTGYSRRALVETVFSRMKGLFSSKLFSKQFDSQHVETYLRCVILNKMNQIVT